MDHEPEISVAYALAKETEIEAGDRLFRPAADWRTAAHLEAGSSTDDGHAMAFKEAGDLLIEKGVEIQAPDLVLLPALFCYRHAAELALKGVIFRWDEVQGRRRPKVKTHDLQTLWNMARQPLEEVADSVWHAAPVLRELADIDPWGDQFRYDRDRTGARRRIPATLASVDLDNLVDVMDRFISTLLDAESTIDEMDEVRID